MKHSKALTSPITHQYAKASGDEFTQERILKEERTGLNKAIKYFSQAATGFKKMQHLFGAYLAKRRESEMMEDYHKCLQLWERGMNDKKQKDKDIARKDMNRAKVKFNKYLDTWKDKWEQQ